MPRSNVFLINPTMESLEFMLRKSQEVIYRKKIQGVGFTASIFEDDSAPISRKTFWKRLDYFQKSKFIVKLLSSDKRTQYYSLTPFGICYYVMNYKNFEASDSKKIIRILKTFNKQQTKLDDTVWDEVNKLVKADNALDRFLIKGMRSVQIYGEEDRKLVRFTYSINTQLESVITLFIIEKEVVGHIYYDPRRGTVMIDWTDEKFYSQIAEHIMEVFCYDILVDADIHGKKGTDLVKNIMHNEETTIIEKAMKLHEKLTIITDEYLELHEYRKNQISHFLS